VLRSNEINDLAVAVRSAVPAVDATVTACSIGVAGPVREGYAKVTNLSWHADARALARALGLSQVGMLNDLEANAWGLPALEAKDFLVLRVGDPSLGGNQALCSAGTGLGEAGIYFDGRMHRPFACEGGHASFSPRDELEVDLWRYLKARHGHVSWERVVSGPGLVNIYVFLRDSKRADEPAWLAERLRGGDAGAEIANAAIAGKSDLAALALDRFVSLWGAEAGNLALKIMATGGVFAGGGIAPKLAGWISRGGFVDAFLDKGRLRALLEQMPVKLILEDSTALLGAARHAATSLH